MTKKLNRSFYQKNALELAPKFLGKFLVHKTNRGIISGKITEVEAYPAFIDKVSHGNKRTKRTEVMYKEGGYAYIYKIYGIHHQFAVVVNKIEVPEVIFIRAVFPEEGIDLMKKNFNKKVDTSQLTKSPGNLCKSFDITRELYGTDLTGDIIWLEDRGESVRDKDILTDKRVGINENLQGSKNHFRFILNKNYAGKRN